ncbi:MAG: hypothetical protein ACLR4Z_02995 [Butyricicoccaceae bacterium]
MGKERLASRFLSSQALLESQKLKTGDLTMDDWDKIARGARRAVESGYLC